ncbi:hypothetical protein MAM1_0314c09568 [Mucor ambiguus]|uniref:Zn(2)-C6 fungal-type domain-containing protein n=1 Tax=Mucor ambiguus TaxID=91626 RepID=A0A0C9MRE0_9FUNG|nr:hypothetical protein MAM1_0314c09568 [Mucor ambiguus]
MTVPTPTPILANNATIVAALNQPTGLIRPTEAPPKRNQVKNACTNCQKACKKCDDARPCPRCEKYGIADTCVNSVRKERKKGIKRGPYKRRQKNNGEEKSKDQQQQQQQQQPIYQAPTSQPPNVPTTATVVPTAAPVATDFGYPTQLSQYASSYGAYGYATVYNTDGTNKEMIAGQYVLPVYSGYPAPILVNGNTTTTQASTASEATTTTSDTSGKPNASECAKNQPLTPVPSTSNSSGTTSPSETHDEDERFTRLTQLCTAALRENKEAEEKAQACAENGENAESIVKEEAQ